MHVIDVLVVLLLFVRFAGCRHFCKICLNHLLVYVARFGSTSLVIFTHVFDRLLELAHPLFYLQVIGRDTRPELLF